jgi:spore maturation protein CgeB
VAARVGLALGAAPGLDIFGDDGWKSLLPEGARLRPPVDYYARLPGIYAKARHSLCLTSLQLPEGLNQRHFDVWMAGGLCLSDDTPGLRLFPEDLVRPIRFRRPEELPKLVAALDNEARRAALIHDWRETLLAAHTSAHRAARILEIVE